MTTRAHPFRTRRFRTSPSSAVALALVLTSPAARALDVGFAVHAEGAAARMVGERKAGQFGWGGSGLAAPELTLGRHFGLELPLGAVGLSDGDRNDAGYVETDEGYGVFALPGMRLRPFGRGADAGPVQLGGLWLAGGGGFAYTGELPRGALDARLGYDFMADGAIRVGPSFGFLQIVEPNTSVRPEDARILQVGIHAAFEPLAQPRRDLDRDDDGLSNDDDRCPDDPEDFDDWQDKDGCPEADNDGDGIPDDRDECPVDPEDFDRFRDHDGCPDRDNDKDGIPDADDACPNVAEDIDGWQDEDGCLDDDNDRDGILDMPDQCPLDAETVNGYADEDGCPDDGQVRVVGSEIILDDRVHFAVNRGDVHPKSWPLLQNVAKLLGANPQYALVRIQGHADDSGDERYNQQLSERRGASVREVLVRFGVAAERLVAEGFGEARPRVAEASVYARRKNRRVEFLILERRSASQEVIPAGEILRSGEVER